MVPIWRQAAGYLIALVTVIAVAAAGYLYMALSPMGCNSTHPETCAYWDDFAICVAILMPVLAGGLWVGRRVGTGCWGRQPDPLRAALAPAPVPPLAVFADCPGCGRQVNREAGRCPYCQAQVEGSGDG